MSEAIQMKPVCFISQVPIDAYGNGGFRFAAASHKGAILCFPEAIYAMDLKAPMPSLIELKQLFDLNVKPELLLLGTGINIEYVPSEIRTALKSNNCRLEVMNTGAAVRTYNVLLAEERNIVAILYPV